MQKRVICGIWAVMFFVGLLGVSSLAAEGIGALEPFLETDRVLILAPHPDDETIACAGIIQQAIASKSQVKIVFLTNGDHNEFAFIVYEKRIPLFKGEFIHLGEVRRLEAIKAAQLLGLKKDSLIFLGYPDFGTFAIFSKFWGDVKPYRSLLTRISKVPYKDNYSYGDPYKGESILEDLAQILKDYKPTKIFVSHPTDTNVDHRALYLFLEIALLDLQHAFPLPEIYPYLVHCVGWPLPRHYHPELSLNPPPQFMRSDIAWLALQLSSEQLEKKHQAILKHKSQTNSSAFYLLSFGRKNELFGGFPTVELKKQVSLKEQAVSFFAFSDLYDTQDMGVLGAMEQVSKAHGKVGYAVVDDALFVRVEKPEGKNRKLSMLFYFFGYNSQTPFARMPKLRIITKHNRFKAYDGRKTVKLEGGSVTVHDNALVLKIPLKVLGNPQWVLTSVRGYRGALPVDATAFRKIEIK